MNTWNRTVLCLPVLTSAACFVDLSRDSAVLRLQLSDRPTSRTEVNATINDGPDVDPFQTSFVADEAANNPSEDIAVVQGSLQLRVDANDATNTWVVDCTLEMSEGLNLVNIDLGSGTCELMPGPPTDQPDAGAPPDMGTQPDAGPPAPTADVRSSVPATNANVVDGRVEVDIALEDVPRAIQELEDSLGRRPATLVVTGVEVVLRDGDDPDFDDIWLEDDSVSVSVYIGAVSQEFLTFVADDDVSRHTSREERRMSADQLLTDPTGLRVTLTGQMSTEYEPSGSLEARVTLEGSL